MHRLVANTRIYPFQTFGSQANAYCNLLFRRRLPTTRYGSYIYEREDLRPSGAFKLDIFHSSAFSSSLVVAALDLDFGARFIFVFSPSTDAPFLWLLVFPWEDSSWECFSSFTNGSPFLASSESVFNTTAPLVQNVTAYWRHCACDVTSVRSTSHKNGLLIP